MSSRVSCVLVALLPFAVAAASSAAILPMPATLEVAIGTLPPASFAGMSPAASSAGAGGAATLPAGSLGGVFQTSIAPPLLTLLDGVGVGAPGLVGSFAGALPASNAQLLFDGTTGTMALNASAYLLMAGEIAAEIPLAVVGVGGTQMFHLLSIIFGTIQANPYQLGMLTVMGALNTAPHTLTGTGFDARTVGGAGTLVLVSPTTVNLGPLGTLAALSTLTLGIPEPGTLALVSFGVAGLAAVGRRQRRR